MAGNVPKSLMRRALEGAIRRAFTKAYDTIKVNPENYLEHLRMAYNLPALTYDGVYTVDPDVLDRIAEDTIRAHMRPKALGLAWAACSPCCPTLASWPASRCA